MVLTKPNEFIPTRQSLLFRLKDYDDQESWREFFETYWKLIYSTALKAGLTEVEAQDVVQETVMCVAKHMPGFQYDPRIGSFKTWLMRLTSWRITDQLRKRLPVHVRRPRRPDENPRTSTINRIPDPRQLDPATIWDAEWDKNLLDLAISRVKGKVRAKQFQAFELAVFQEWPGKRIAKAMGVSTAAVYVAKHRISRLLKKELTKLQSEMTKSERI